jgi:hypothetical protein
MAALGTATDFGPTTTHNEQISGRSSVLSKNTCLLSSKDCLNNYNQNQYIAISRPSRTAVSSPKTSTALDQTSICQKVPALTAAYNKTLFQDLANTNQSADSIRNNSEISGEPYLAFDEQLNNIFTAYNSQVQLLYSNYLNSLGKCSPLASPPILFSMFTP